RIANLARSTARYALAALAAGHSPVIPPEVRPLVQKAGGLEKWIRLELGAEAHQPRSSPNLLRNGNAPLDRGRPPQGPPSPGQKTKPIEVSTRTEFKTKTVVTWFDHETGCGRVRLVGRSVEAFLPASVVEARFGSVLLAPG